MNNQVVSQYNEYLKLTSGDEAAAASLTLAAIMLEGRSESPAPPAVSRGETGGQFRGIRGPSRALRNRGEMGATCQALAGNGWQGGGGVIKLDRCWTSRR